MRVKLECSLSGSSKDNETQYVTINQTIFYQVLKKKLNLIKNKLIYIALVDEKRNKIKAKVLSKKLK